MSLLRVCKSPDDSPIFINPKKIFRPETFNMFNVLNLLKDPIVIHEGRKTIFANRSTIEYFGTEILDEIIEFAHPDRRDLVRKRFERVAECRDSEHYEELFIMRDGSRIWFEIEHHPLSWQKYVVTIFRDVTDKKK